MNRRRRDYWGKKRRSREERKGEIRARRCSVCVGFGSAKGCGFIAGGGRSWLGVGCCWEWLGGSFMELEEYSFKCIFLCLEGEGELARVREMFRARLSRLDCTSRKRSKCRFLFLLSYSVWSWISLNTDIARKFSATTAHKRHRGARSGGRAARLAGWRADVRWHWIHNEMTCVYLLSG